MNDSTNLWMPMHVVSPDLIKGIKSLEDLHRIPVSETDPPEQNLILMIGKLIHMTKTLSVCIKTDDSSTIEVCERLAGEIRWHERLATAGLIRQASVTHKKVFKTVVYLPSRMERLSIMIGNILDCCRVRIAGALQFSDKAQSELSEIFETALGMLKKLGGGLVVPNKFLLNQIRSDGRKLDELVEAARCANWERMQSHICPPQRASLYVEILDCFRNVNEGVGKIYESLLALADSEPKTGNRRKAALF